MWEARRASGKAVWMWPPVVAADAGLMEIEFREGAVWRWADAELERATTDSMRPSAG